MKDEGRPRQLNLRNRAHSSKELALELNEARLRRYPANPVATGAICHSSHGPGDRPLLPPSLDPCVGKRNLRFWVTCDTDHGNKVVPNGLGTLIGQKNQGGRENQNKILRHIVRLELDDLRKGAEKPIQLRLGPVAPGSRKLDLKGPSFV
jgi:hypothetical protein